MEKSCQVICEGCILFLFPVSTHSLVKNTSSPEIRESLARLKSNFFQFYRFTSPCDAVQVKKGPTSVNFIYGDFYLKLTFSVARIVLKWRIVQ